jgi:flagellar biosynthetic protein FliO
MSPRFVGRLMVFLILALAGLPAWAADGPAPGPVGAEVPDLMTAGLKMTGALLLILGGMMLVLYLLRRHGLGPGRYLSAQEAIRIIGTRPLGPRKYLALVEIGDRVLTLAVTNDHITCLDKMPAARFHAQVKTGEPPSTPTFRKVLQAIRPETGPGPESSS